MVVATPGLGRALEADARTAAAYWEGVAEELRRLPPRPRRSPKQQSEAEALLAASRRLREEFMAAHAAEVYDALTSDRQRLLRVRALVHEAAERFPGLVPAAAEVERERELPQKDKDGVEIDQGIFLAHILADRLRGRHLMHSMQRPLPEAEARLDELRRTGSVDLGTARVDRRGKTGHITLQNHEHLNAEDDHSNQRLEVAVDLVLLDPDIEVGVLRGGPATHPKHAGRRIFGSGINLTHLYHGKIGFIDFLIERELGLNNKMFRGHSLPEFRLSEFEETHEKPFIAAVESWAIGGACQWLLIMDHVIAEQGAYFNLPARKEGIIPGSANLRMPRFAADRLTRQAIFFNRDFPASSPEGRLLCDEVVDAAEMEAAIERAAAELTSAGRESLVGNRRMLRQGEEPIDVHRLYMAGYCRDQAYCQYSPALIDNLERNWNAKQRGLKGAGR
jgi:thioesterase DpgC